MDDRRVKRAVRVSQGEVVDVVEKEQLPVKIEPEPHSEEVKADVLQAVEEESGDGSKGEKILADEDVVSLVRRCTGRKCRQWG